MDRNLYTYVDFIDDLRRREIPLVANLIRKLPKILNEVINQEEVLYFYGKGLFNEKEKQLYLFFSDKVVQVLIFKRNIQFRTIKHEVLEANYQIGTDDLSTRLSIKFSNGEKLDFDSMEDSDYNWEKAYAEAIREIYRLY